MGYVRHHAILVTTEHDYEGLDAARAHAVTLGCHVSPTVDGAINGVRTFLVAPDGSKEGWDESDDGDRRRAALIDWLVKARYDDGSSGLKWCEVIYGDDSGLLAVRGSAR